MDAEGRPRLNPDPDRVAQLFEGASSREGPERKRFLDESCADDPELRREVESLLEAAGLADDFLENPVFPTPVEPEVRESEPLDLSELESRYEIQGRLAVGGMGTIYRVRHRLLDQIRVAKVIRPELQRDSRSRDRFHREARVATRLQHPNLAQVHDFMVTADGAACLVMELIDGRNLADVLRTCTRLEPGFAAEIATQALRGLAYLHGEGFVHRDVSTDNLMLTRDSRGRPRVKLIDLGIAKSLQAGPGLTCTGHFVGKLLYSPPEAFRGSGANALDPRADLYALGVVLYQLLTGRVPIRGTDYATLIAGHLFYPPISFDESDPEGRVNEAIRAVVSRALAKSVGDRFPGAEEMRVALEAAAGEDRVDPDWDRSLPPLRAETMDSGPGEPRSREDSGWTRTLNAAGSVAGASTRAMRSLGMVGVGMGLAAVVTAVALLGWFSSGETVPEPPAAVEDPGTDQMLPLDLPAAAAGRMGTVALDAHPWARVESVIQMSDGVEVEVGDLVTPCRLELSPGDYRISLRHQGLDPREVEVRVEPGTVARLSHRFPEFDPETVVEAQRRRSLGGATTGGVTGD